MLSSRVTAGAADSVFTSPHRGEVGERGEPGEGARDLGNPLTPTLCPEWGEGVRASNLREYQATFEGSFLQTSKLAGLAVAKSA